MKRFDPPPPIDGAPARNTDPVTSHIAAAMLPTGMLEKMFLEALEVNPRLTTTEIARMYQMERDSFSPRPDALKRKKLIVQDGTRLVHNKAGHLRPMIAFRLRRDTDTRSDMTPRAQRRLTARQLAARVRALEAALHEVATYPATAYARSDLQNVQRIAREALKTEQET